MFTYLTAGGQNHNSTLLKFCTWLSKVYAVEFIQLFPVQGHFFTQCDRNFGLVRSKVKKQEVIGRANPQLDAMVHSKILSPFVFSCSYGSGTRQRLGRSPCSLSFLDMKISITKQKFTIMKYVMIEYKNNGRVLFSENYLFLMPTGLKNFCRNIVMTKAKGLKATNETYT